MELLARYSTPNQDIDFDKAIRENPENYYLKEYKAIVRQIEKRGLVLTSATLLRDPTQYPNKCYEFTWLRFPELVL
ncbi:hypothetical protein C5S39_07190 [Candidatus Methanophagaceae archaeon]|nr:hypothetical protein C5S39_07190 [Methanophagales archaeon]